MNIAYLGIVLRKLFIQKNSLSSKKTTLEETLTWFLEFNYNSSIFLFAALIAVLETFVLYSASFIIVIASNCNLIAFKLISCNAIRFVYSYSKRLQMHQLYTGIVLLPGIHDPQAMDG